MEVFLEGVERRGQLVRRRRYVGRFLRRAVRGSNPVLPFPELTRGAGPAPHAFQQDGVELPEQPQGDRQVGEPAQAVLQGADVVEDLAHVLGVAVVPQLQLHRFPGVDVGQGGPGALYARRQHGLPPHERAHQKVGFGHDAAQPRELPHGAVRRRQRGRQRGRPGDLRRQGIRHEGPVPLRRSHQAPGSRAAKSSGFKIPPAGFP